MDISIMIRHDIMFRKLNEISSWPSKGGLGWNDLLGIRAQTTASERKKEKKNIAYIKNVKQIIHPPKQKSTGNVSGLR